MFCETCEAIHDGSYGSGRFCCLKCARAFSTKAKRDQINAKVSQSLTGRSSLKKGEKLSKPQTISEEERQRRSSSQKARWQDPQRRAAWVIAIKLSAKSHAASLSDLQRQELSDRAKRTGLCWPSRKKPSYPETYCSQWLRDHGVSFETQKSVGRYFLDFTFQNQVCLEIDGAQHQWPERVIHDTERDAWLTSSGWKVHRIAWRSVRSVEGKQSINSSLEAFLREFAILK